MGEFYSSIIVKGARKEAIKLFLLDHQRHCFMSPEEHGITVVFDQQLEHQNIDDIHELASVLSFTLDCDAMACIIHDTSLFMYWLYVRGALVDTYNEFPDYFEDDKAGLAAPIGGNAELLCTIFDTLQARHGIDDLLHHADHTDSTGDELHREIVSLLGLPSYAAGVGFYAIEDAKQRNTLVSGVRVSLFEELSPQA